MYYINNVLMNMKKIISELISKSDISPIKFILGLTSLLWVLIDCYQTNSGFMLMMFCYGAWLLWLMVDDEHRKISSTIMSSLGVALWSYELCSTILYDPIDAHPVIHYATRIILLFASIWVLIQMGNTRTR